MCGSMIWEYFWVLGVESGIILKVYGEGGEGFKGG